MVVEIFFITVDQDSASLSLFSSSQFFVIILLYFILEFDPKS